MNRIPIKLFIISLLWLLIFNLASARVISLFDAIQTALDHNETIMFNAQQSYLSSLEQLNSIKSFYRTHLQLVMNNYYNYSRMQSINNFVDYRYRSLNPVINLNYTLLTPLGSRTSLGFNYHTLTTGNNTFHSSPEFSLTWQQPLSLAGIQSGHADIIRAKSNYTRSEMTYQLQKESLVLTVINTYFQLWQAYQNIEQSKQDFESARRVLKIAEMQLKAGQISEFEVMNTRVQFKISEDNLKVAQNNSVTQKRNFLRLLGIKDLEMEIQLAQEIEIDTTDFDLEFARQTGSETRLEVKQAEISLKLADLGLKQAAASFFPTLFVNGSYSLSSQYDVPFKTALGNLPNRNWQVQANLILPIMDGGARSSQLQMARHDYNIQLKNLELLHQDIAIEIEEQFRSIQLNRDRIHSLSLNLDIAAEALKIAELRFQQGQVSSTEIENIRQRYNNAQNSLNNAKIYYITRSAELAKAMGILDKWVKNLNE